MSENEEKKGDRVFLSCLGVGPYSATQYGEKGANRAQDMDFGQATPFIQVERLRALAGNGIPPKNVRILITSKAADANWTPSATSASAKPEENSRSSEPKQWLSEEIAKLGFPSHEAYVRVDDGINEEQLWRTFQSLSDCIGLNDELYVDITHGFRSLSVIMVVALNYLTKVKGAIVKEVTYGAFEGRFLDVPELEPHDKRRPTFDLTPFFVLEQWSEAVATFRLTRDLRPIAKIFLDAAKSARKSQGRDADNAIKDLPTQLVTLADALSECRLADLRELSGKAIKSMRTAENALAAVNSTRPIVPLLSNIREIVATLCVDDSVLGSHVSTGLAAARWFMEARQYHTGLTYLNESMYLAVAAKVNASRPGSSLPANHSDSSTLLNMLSRYYDSNQDVAFPTLKPAITKGNSLPNFDVGRQFYEWAVWKKDNQQLKDFCALAERVRKLRNALNHCHTGNDKASHHDIEEFQKELLNGMVTQTVAAFLGDWKEHNDAQSEAAGRVFDGPAS